MCVCVLMKDVLNLLSFDNLFGNLRGEGIHSFKNSTVHIEQKVFRFSVGLCGTTIYSIQHGSSKFISAVCACSVPFLVSRGKAERQCQGGEM